MQFRDDSLELCFADLQWARNQDKVRALLLDIFSRRARFSPVQGRLWCRVIHLYWRAGWTARQIGDQFGVSLKNIRRIIQNLRREAATFFGQSAQPAQPGQVVQSKKTKPIVEAAPIEADPANESQEHWNAVLASHGLPDPDRRARGWSWKNPEYKFAWPSRTSVHALGWREFYETQAKPEPTFRTQQKTGGTGSWGKANQVGTRTVVVDGKSHEARVFEAGRACTFGWAADPRRNAGSPADKGYLAHTVTDRSLDGDPEAREYLREYDRLEAEKYTNEKLFKIVPAIDDPCEGRPFMQDFAVAPTGRGIDVWIDTDGTVYKGERGESKQPWGHLDKTMSGETTRAVRQIGRAEPNEQAIPVRDSFFADATEYDSYFLGQRHSQQLEELMQHQQAAEIIKQHDIPRSTVARLSGLYLSDLSGWLNGRTDLAQDKIERVSIVVVDISKMIDAMATVDIKVDLSDVDNARRLIQKMNDYEAQMILPLPDAQEPLRMKPIEHSGTAAD
jgi:hypothetical protein